MSGDAPTPEQIAALRARASEVIERTFRALAEEHVLPRPRFAPWLRLARDYYGDSLRGGSALADALDAAYPDRFRREPPRGYDLPWGYDSALVEAAVAAASRSGEPYAVASPSVARVLDEFLDGIAADPIVRVANVVADIATGDGAEIVIAGVRVVPAPSGAERLLERSIPSSGFVIERQDAISLGSGGTAVLLAEEQGRADLEALESAARVRVRTLLASIRLATGTTAMTLADVAGHPSRVHGTPPAIHSSPGSGGLRLTHRTATVTPDMVAGLDALASMLVMPPSGPAPSHLIAMGRLTRVLDEPDRNVADTVVDLAIGIEAALGGRSRPGISRRLTERAAGLLAAAEDPATAVRDDVRILYDLRSAFVHGSSMTPDRLGRKVAGVSAAAGRDRWRGEQLDLATDRWRDLLRRAVLSRMALAAGEGAPWPAGSADVDVDRELADPAGAAHWRDRITAYWESVGLPCAVSPAQPLSGVLSQAEPVSGAPADL